jgi:hypothetical protein
MRHNQTLADILLDYTEEVNRGEDGGIAESYLRQYPEYRHDLRALMRIVRQLKRFLKPVRPSAAYRQALGDELVEAAREHLVPRITVRNPFRRQRLIIWGAAIGSVVSVIAGIVAAVLIHNKNVQRSHGVPSA